VGRRDVQEEEEEEEEEEEKFKPQNRANAIRSSSSAIQTCTFFYL